MHVNHKPMLNPLIALVCSLMPSAALPSQTQAPDPQGLPVIETTQSAHPVPASDLWLTYPGGEGPGAGKHIVFIAADQEYRSEQSLPMLARTLSAHHGFHCTVLFSLNKEQLVVPTMKIRWEDKTINHNVPGLEHLAAADLALLFSRLITLPEEQLQHIYTYLDSGKPLIALRTANHGFIGFNYKVEGKRVQLRGARSQSAPAQPLPLACSWTGGARAAHNRD